MSWGLMTGLGAAPSAARPPIPNYLYFCIRQALFRPGEPVPTRLGYLVTCADAAGLVGRVGS